MGHTDDRGQNEQQHDVEVAGLEMTKREYIIAAMGRMDASVQKELLAAGFEADDLSRVTVPVLALTGEEPAASHDRAAERLADEIPDGRRDTIPDANHGGNITNLETSTTHFESLSRPP